MWLKGRSSVCTPPFVDLVLGKWNKKLGHQAGEDEVQKGCQENEKIKIVG